MILDYQSLVAIIEHMPVAVFAKDANDDYRFVLWNKKMEDLFGLSNEKVIGLSDFDLFSKEEANHFRRFDEKVMSDGEVINIEQENVTTHKGTVICHTLKVPLTLANDQRLLLGILEDITEEVNNKTELKKYHTDLESIVEKRTMQLRELADKDSLTGLYNRGFVLSRIVNIIEENQFPNGFAIVFIDLNGFKLLNDSYGHRLGDELLCQVGKRLKAFDNQAQWIARLGGDEFVLVANSNDHITLTKLAKAISEAISQPFQLYKNNYEITCSIGISRWPDDANEATLLLQAADMAMYDNKKGQSNKYATFYNNSMLIASQRQLEIEQALRHALNKDELYLTLQPQFNTESSQTLFGAEILLRWNSDKLGPVSPSEFIPIAEKSGLMPIIDQWVLKKSCQLIADWKSRYDEVPRLSINLSGKEFDVKLCEQLRCELANFNLSPEVLMLEVTETELANFSPELIQELNLLREQGLKISIDDFGTGYSSLAYLSKVGFDEIKVDRSFVMKLPDDNKSCQLVYTIASMAKALKCQVVAEGVENTQQLNCLHELEVKIIQGFLLGKPMLPDEFEKHLL